LTLAPTAALTTTVLLGPLAALLVGRLNSRTRNPTATVAPQTPLALMLLAAALRAGEPLAAAVELAAPAAGEETGKRFLAVVGLLRLGADPAQAWVDDESDDGWTTIARVARQSSHSGVRAASAFEQLAIELRARRRADGESRAERAAVYAVAPLGLCFLPAFVCVGIVPVVVGIVSGLGLRLQ
jgi:Flp pilus assembly protein TadB